AKASSFICLLRCRRRHAAISVIGGAGAFRGDHGHPERMFRRAARAEGGALRRLALAAKDEAADAFALCLGLRHDGADTGLRVAGAIGVGEPEAALLDLADAAPAPPDHLEDLAHDLLGGGVAFSPHRPRILVLDLGGAGLELADAEIDALEDV